MKYTRKASEVIAIQFTGDNEQNFQAQNFSPDIFDAWLDSGGNLRVQFSKWGVCLKPTDWLVYDGLYTLAYTNDEVSKILNIVV